MMQAFNLAADAAVAYASDAAYQELHESGCDPAANATAVAEIVAAVRQLRRSGCHRPAWELLTRLADEVMLADNARQRA